MSDNNNSAPAEPDPLAEQLALLSPKQQRVILVCDVVESVRWMEHDEDYAITRWSQFAHHVREHIAPAHGARVVKSTGDGLLMEFASTPQAPSQAVQVASALHRHAHEGNAGQSAEHQMQLRIGIHQAPVRADAHDLYGHGVNLAARITTLAGPGEIMVTPEVRDHLTDSLDGDIEDMGECYLKHLDEPQRVFRVGEVSKQPILNREADYSSSLKPTLAIVPFEPTTNSLEQRVIGDLIADGVIARLVRSNTVRVLSRYSTAAMRGSQYCGADYKALLNADYVVRGSFVQAGEKTSIGFELCATVDNAVLMADRINGEVRDLFLSDSVSCAEIATVVINAIIDEQLKSSLTKPLPNLASYSLYLMGVAGIHRTMPRENQIGEQALRHIIERHPRSAEPAVWLAQWLTIKASRGLEGDLNSVKSQAMSYLGRALDAQPNNSFALAVSGLVDAYLLKEFSKAEAKYDQAIDLNPNECLAWLYKATLLSWTDRSEQASFAAEKALALSPLHPIRYYIESLAAVPFLTAGRYDKAIDLCKSSIKSNKMHTSTYRVLAAALQLAGDANQARACISQLLDFEPSMTSTKFIKRYPGSSSKFALLWQSALLEAGLPR